LKLGRDGGIIFVLKLRVVGRRRILRYECLILVAQKRNVFIYGSLKKKYEIKVYGG
jgi:hypothetical protein